MISPERIAEITALAEAATPGGWIAAVKPSMHGWPVVSNTGRMVASMNYVQHSAIDPKVTGDDAFNRESAANAAFIAAARTAVPELLAENTRLSDLAKANNDLARHNSDAFVAERAKTTALIEEREAMVARIAVLTEALIEQNEALRSACVVADRDGRETNWLSLRGRLHWVLAEYHELTNTARAALKEQS